MSSNTMCSFSSNSKASVFCAWGYEFEPSSPWFFLLSFNTGNFTDKWLSFFLCGLNKVALFKIFSGQNKNNAMIHYLLWRLTTGRTTGTIELNFMLAGHTKFAPDQHFGTIKKCFSRTFVSSLSELSAVSTQAYWNLTLYIHCSSEIIVYLRYNLSDAPPLHSCNELPHHL